MKIHKEIQQQTEEWFALKWGKIGGSRAKALRQMTEMLIIELIAESVESFEMDTNGYTSDAMLRGITLEPIARESLSEFTGLEFNQVGWIQSEIGLIGISPDGITSDLTKACEIKCPQAKRHIETCLSNEIPLDNIDQCIHYFTANNKLKELYFLSYRPEFTIMPMFVKKIDLNSKVNIGTEKKPIYSTIYEVVQMNRIRAKEIQEEINNIVNQLKF